jgi:hypothetical protein
MRNNFGDTPVKVQLKEAYGDGEFELVTLEQLYRRCVKENKADLLVQNGVDTLLKEMKVVLRAECYKHLAKLMGNADKVNFAKQCVENRRTPFEASMDAHTPEGKRRAGKCYWPDCP